MSSLINENTGLGSASLLPKWGY